MVDSGKQSGVNRRRFIQALSGTMAASLAGCGGEGGGSNGELGERVPTQSVILFGDEDQPTWEDIFSVVRGNWNELGLEFEARPMPIGEYVGELLNNTRSLDLGSVSFGSSPGRVDPHELIRSFAADYAGANGLPNFSNYANCEYTHPAIQQGTAPDEATRRDLVHKAMRIFSEDYANISTNEIFYYQVVNEREVEARGLGEQGLQPLNAQSYIQSRAKNGNEFVAGVSPELLAQRNHLKLGSIDSFTFWNNVPFSPVLGFDENYELVNVLAANREVEDEFRQVTYELNDATFHDGSPLTAEDVKFSFKYFHDNAGLFPYGSQFPFAENSEDSITVIDEKTVQFQFSESFPPFVSRETPRVGIVPSDVWREQGAVDNPEGFVPEGFIGSGPMQVTNFQRGQSMTLEPFGGHPSFDAQSRIILSGFRSPTAEVQAFREEEIHVNTSITYDQLQQLQDQVDFAQGIQARGLFSYSWMPMGDTAPTKFREFRNALGTAVDRQRIEQVALGGNGPPHAYPLHHSEAHPWRAPNEELTKFTDDMSGDIEGAKQILSDAGWGWDDDGRLHYPPDADLEPLWPKGEQPTSEDGFPCLDADGNYAGPS